MATQRPNYQGGAPLDFSQVTQGLTQIILGQQQAAAAAAAEERKRNDQLYSAVEDLAYKIDPSGVRSADVQIFTDRYNEEVRGTMIDALVARQQGDMRRFTTLVTQAKENIRKLNIDINSNKKISEQEAKLLEDMRRYPERYTQEDKDRLERRLSTSYREIPDGLSIDSPSWGRRIDTSNVPGKINKIVEDLLKHQGQSTGVTSRRFGDNTQYIDNLSLSAGVAASALLAHENDPTFRAYFEQQYPGVDYQTAVQAHVSGMVADGRLSKQDSLAVNRDRAPRESSGTDAQREATYRQQHIAALFAGEEWALADLRGAIGTGITKRTPVVEYQGNTLTIRRPHIINDKGAVEYSIDETIDLTTPEAEAKLNRILNQVTGQNVTVGAMRTAGGHPRGPLVFQNPNVPGTSGGNNTLERITW